MMPMEPLKVAIPGAAGISPTFESLECEEPQKVAPSPTLQPTDAAIAPPPGLADLAKQEPLEQEIASSPLALSLAQMLEEEDDAKYQVEISPFMMGTESADAAAHVFPSEGSKLHGTGFCRPCAWFWKLMVLRLLEQRSAQTLLGTRADETESFFATDALAFSRPGQNHGINRITSTTLDCA